MSEQMNPYANIPDEQTQALNFDNPQPPANEHPVQQNARQPVQQPVQQNAWQPVPPPVYQQPMYPQQPVPQPVPQQRPVRAGITPEEREKLKAEKARGQAKGYGITSFIIGCISVIAIIMIVFNFQITISDKWYWAFRGSLFFALPGIIFGTVSLAKKPENKLFTLLGLAFAVALVITALAFYFVTVNSGAHLYWPWAAKE